MFKRFTTKKQADGAGTNGASAPLFAASPVNGPVQSTDGTEIEDLLKRLHQVVQAGSACQVRLADQIEALVKSQQAMGPAVVPVEFSNALSALPGAVRAAAEIPERTLTALDRIEGLAATIRSHQQLQRRTADDLSGMRSDLQKFLTTVSTAVTELTELHRSSLDQGRDMALRQKEVFHSHRMHAAEMRRLHDQAREEMAEAHIERERQYEHRIRMAGRKISVTVGCVCVVMLVSSLIAAGVIDLRAAVRPPAVRSAEAAPAAPAETVSSELQRIPDPAQRDSGTQ